MTINKTIQVPYISGVSTLTIDVLREDGSTILQSGITLSETIANSMTYDGTLTAAVTLGTYRVNLLRAGRQIAQLQCDLNELVGNYPAFDGPTPLQNITNIPPIQNNVYVTVTPEMAQTAIEPSLIVCKRGDTLAVVLPPLGSITGWQKIYFTAKQYGTDLDSAAMLQIVAIAAGGGGLLTLLGSQTVTAADGSLTVSDTTLGTVSVSLIAADTKLFPIQKWFWDAEVVYANGSVYTPVQGVFNVVMDITQTAN